MKRDSEDPNFKLINLILSAVLGAVIFSLLGERFFPRVGSGLWAYGAFVIWGAIVGAIGNTLYGDEIWEAILKLYHWWK